MIILLLVASALINYMDRSNLSVAAPVIQTQLALTPLQLGSLLAAFSWTYALLQLSGFSGCLSDRFPVGYVMLCGYVTWSVATFMTGLLSGLTMLFAARLLLGAGESIAYPCYSRIFAELPQEHRGRANAAIDAATKLGPSVGALLGGFLLVHFGWRFLFIALGAGGLLWILPWLRTMPRSRSQCLLTSEKSLPSIRELLSKRAAWGAFLGHFCGNYFFYFLLAWLPNYFVHEEKFSLQQMTHLTSAVFLVVALTTLLTGWISDKIITAGVSPNAVRKTVVSGGLAIASVLCVLGLPEVPRIAGILVLFTACIGYGAYCSNHWAISQTLAGPGMAGRWTGVQNGIGNLSGIVAPWIAGASVQFSGNSRAAFLVTGLFALLGSLSWALIVTRVEPVVWNHPSQS
jgi:ACS family D-galactonate transporter-like MFS transporter